jgi:hypothetical protein
MIFFSDNILDNTPLIFLDLNFIVYYIDLRKIYPGDFVKYVLYKEN